MRRETNAQRIAPSHGQTPSFNPVKQRSRLVSKRSRPGAAAEAAFSFSLLSYPRYLARHKSRDKSLVVEGCRLMLIESL